MIFSIETSTSNLSLTLLSNSKVFNKLSIKIKNELSEIIIPTIKKFMTDNSITFQSVSLLVVGCGPGSFTSIRALISAAKGIYLSNKHMKILGINSLAGLAMSALNEAKNINVEYILASIDTKRNDQFLQLFKINNCNKRLLPFSVINNIEPIKIENSLQIESERLFKDSFPKILTVARLDKRKNHQNILMCHSYSTTHISVK